ncbi:hypothetical protein FOZ63_003299, partial [Perkinsus olseni]
GSAAGPTVPKELDIIVYIGDYCIRGQTFVEVICQHDYMTWRLKRSPSTKRPSPAGNYTDWNALCSGDNTKARYDLLQTVNDQLPVPRSVDLSDTLNVFTDASQLAFCVDEGSVYPAVPKLRNTKRIIESQ